MSDQSEKKPDQSKSGADETRRDFLKKIGIAGAAVAAGGAAIYSGRIFEKAKGNEEYVKVLTEDNKIVKVPKDQIHHLRPQMASLQERGREGLPGKSWVKVIDLSKCRNARACINSCQSAHQLRTYQYHINTLVMQESKTTKPYFMPKPCQHCDNPPCTSVCPVNATYKRQDGIVLIDNERCIGCRFCMAACPYSARVFNWEEPPRKEEFADMKYDVELNVPQKKGTISKCVFSADRLREGKMPYCVESCPNGVFWFGDRNEDTVTNGTTKETVRFSQLIRDNAGYRLMPELGTEPRVYYLPSKNPLFDFPDEAPSPDSFVDEA